MTGPVKEREVPLGRSATDLPNPRMTKKREFNTAPLLSLSFSLLFMHMYIYL